MSEATQPQSETSPASGTPLGGATGNGLVDHILTPGSTLDPRFLLILDVAFTVLSVLLVALYVVTSFNIHFLALIVIELALWASVKW